MKDQLKNELHALLYLSLCAISILLVWIGLFHWSPERIIAGHDSLLGDLLYTKTYFNSGLEGSLYRFDLFGGNRLAPLTGIYWIQPLCRFLGFAPHAPINLSIFFLQTLYAFFGLRIIYSWAPRSVSWPRSIILSTLIALVLAFHPLLIMRFANGHATLLMGYVAFIGLIALVRSYIRHSVTLTEIIAFALCLLFSLQIPLMQSLVYPALFGLPIFIAFLSTAKNRIRFFWLAIPCGLGVLLIAYPILSMILDTFLGGEASRATASEANAVYSYITSTLNDWVFSIGLFPGTLASSREAFMNHEIFYPMVPFLLVFLLSDIQEFRKIRTGLLISLSLAILFAMNIGPVSGLLLDAAPILRSFRVPARSVIPVALLLPPLAFTAIFLRVRSSSQITLGTQSTVYLLLPLLFFLPQFALEVLCLAIVPALVRLWPTNPKLHKWLSATFLIGTLAATCFISSYRLRPTLAESQPIAQQDAAIYALALQSSADLANPLYRVAVDLGPNAMLSNISFSSGLSSLQGYGFIPKSFLNLYFSLLNQPLLPTFMNLQADSLRPVLKELALLYNINHFLLINPDRTLTIQPSHLPTMGPAWFSTSVVPLNSWAEMAETIRRLAGKREPQGSLPYFEKDAQFSSTFQECKTARYESLEVDRKQHLSAQLDSPTVCPLTISTNFSSLLAAYATTHEGQRIKLKTFPAYGVLLGVEAPPGKYKLEVFAEWNPPISNETALLIGILLILLGTGAAIRFQNLHKQSLNP